MPRPVRSMSEGAKELVERSRAGDQNAMGTIAIIRQRALFGRDVVSPRDRLVSMTSYHLIKDYLDAHPVAEMGAEAQAAQKPVDAKVLSYVHPDVPEWMPMCLSECLPKKGGFMAVVVRLANVRTLSGDDLERASLVMGPEHQNTVLAGALKQRVPKGSVPGDESGTRLAFLLGCCLGTAMTLQAVREGRAGIAWLSPEASWELGE